MEDVSNKAFEISDHFLCLILALAFSSSFYYMETGGCVISLSFIMTSIVTFGVFSLVTWMLRTKLINQECCWQKKNKISKFMEKKYHLLIIWGIILAFWVPIFILLYPGTIINDSWGQLQQYMSFVANGSLKKGVLYDHHPIFDTLYMGILIVPLAETTGKWHIIIFLYVLLQAVFTSFSFACTIDYAYRKLQIGTNILVLMLGVYCILPIYPASVQTISKDALFAWIYVLFFLYYIEIVRSKGEVLKKRKHVIGFIVISILCCLTKKVGIYVVEISVLFIFIFQRTNKKKILLSIVCVSCFMFGVMPAIKTELGVQNGGKQEMFSIPFQQTARYVKYHRDDITEEEYKVIDKLLDMKDLAERYDPTSADPVKGYVERGTSKDYIDYIKVWFSQGIRHLETYIAAFNAMEAGWFSWYEYKPLMNMNWHDQLNSSMIPEWVSVRGESFSRLAQEYEKMFDNLYENPILKIFFSYGLYASLVPAFAFGTVIRKWRKKDVKYWLALIPMMLSIVLGCWLSPVSTNIEGVRYLYPITYTTPLIIVWCVYIYKRNCTNNIKKEV